MLTASLTSSVTLTSNGENVILGLEPSTDAGSYVILNAHTSCANLSALEVTWGNGEDTCVYNNEDAGDITILEIRGYANAYGDNEWGMSLFLIGTLNEDVIEIFSGTVNNLPLELTLNPTFSGSGHITVIDAAIVQVV